MKKVVEILIIPIMLAIIAFLGNFFFFEYQTTKASVLLYSDQINSIRQDIQEIKESQKEIMRILMEDRRK